MIRYVIKRILWIIPMVLFVTLLVFFAEFTPASARQLLGNFATEELLPSCVKMD